jgi:hypothetical protein
MSFLQRPPWARWSRGCCSSTAGKDLHRHFSTVEVPLNSLTEKELCPGSAALEKINASLR